MKKSADIFISYRRDGGDGLAGRIRDALTQRGYRVFLDVEDLKTGRFNEALLAEIEGCNDFVVILSSGALDRCVNEGDWLRREVGHALKFRKHIVPVIGRNFHFPKGSLPADIDDLRHYNGLSASHDLFEASMDKLASMLRSSKRSNVRPWFLRLAIAVLAASIIVAWINHSLSIRTPAATEVSRRIEAPTLEDLLLAADRIAESILRTLGQKGLLYAKEGPITVMMGRVANNTPTMLDTDVLIRRIRSKLGDAGAIRLKGRSPGYDEQMKQTPLDSYREFSVDILISQTPNDHRGYDFAFSGTVTSLEDGMTIWEDIIVIAK